MNAVRFLGASGSDNRKYRDADQKRCTQRLSTASDGNISIQFHQDGRPVRLELPPIARELLDLAACVYVLDEIDDRSSQDDGWSRTFNLVFPVDVVRPWNAALGPLSRALQFLAGDTFQLEFVKGERLGAIGRGRSAQLNHYDVVCLFSGGADSFVGAWRLLESGRRVLRVSHYADGIASSAQDELFSVLDRTFPNQASLIKCYVATAKLRSSPNRLKAVESSHRTRSFLFLVLGAVVAHMFDVPDVAIAENGLIAINPPLGLSRLGTLSTRTAHPRYLADYDEATRAVGMLSGRLFNPFSAMTKNEVVVALIGIHAALTRSISCSSAGRVRTMTGKARRAIADLASRACTGGQPS